MVETLIFRMLLECLDAAEAEGDAEETASAEKQKPPLDSASVAAIEARQSIVAAADLQHAFAGFMRRSRQSSSSTRR